jgi:cbb3-type cytochrome oxidase maturation protein
VDIVIALVFISLMLVVGALVFFLSRMRAGDFDHGDRLSLLPLSEDEQQPSEAGAEAQADAAAAPKKKKGGASPLR